MKSMIQTAAVLVAVAVGLPAWASEGDAGGAALLTPRLGTIFWTVLTFVALLVLLRRFAWGPLLGAIDAREQSIRDSFEQAAEDRRQAEALIEEHRQLLIAARRERAEAVEHGKRDAERVRAEILDAAKSEGERRKQEAQAQIDAGLRKAEEELRSVAVDLAIRAAGKLLAKNLDDATQRQLVEEHLADLERRPGDSSSLPS